jgi:hypothetical protein
LHHHAVIWIDHREARVFHFNATDVEKLVLHPENPTRHLHHKANSIGSGNAAEDHAYLQAVWDSVMDAGAILITGPVNAKTELVKHIERHDPKRNQLIAASKPLTIQATARSSLTPGNTSRQRTACWRKQAERTQAPRGSALYFVFRFAAGSMSGYGPSRHFAATQQFGRLRSEAGIQRAALTEPDL